MIRILILSLILAGIGVAFEMNAINCSEYHRE